MTPTELLSSLSSQGITVVLRGQELACRGRKSAVTPETLALVRQYKPELLELLGVQATQNTLLARLRNGHLWLMEVHQKLMAEEKLYGTMADRLADGLNAFEALEKELRETYEFEGCIMGEGRHCPTASPVCCLACVAAREGSNELRQ